jgi:hypothetical protein
MLGSVGAAIALNRPLLELRYQLRILGRAQKRATVTCQFSETNGIAHLGLPADLLASKRPGLPSISMLRLYAISGVGALS